MSAQSTEILIWLAVLIIASTVVAAVGMAMYRRLTRDSSQDVATPAFTLSDLRRLHRAGELTDEEYERAKARMIAGYKAASAGEEGNGAAGEEGGETDGHEEAPGDDRLGPERDDESAGEGDADRPSTPDP